MDRLYPVFAKGNKNKGNTPRRTLLRRPDYNSLTGTLDEFFSSPSGYPLPGVLYFLLLGFFCSPLKESPSCPLLWSLSRTVSSLPTYMVDEVGVTKRLLRV